MILYSACGRFRELHAADVVLAAGYLEAWLISRYMITWMS
jgi:hypothetical protein